MRKVHHDMNMYVLSNKLRFNLGKKGEKSIKIVVL